MFEITQGSKEKKKKKKFPPYNYTIQKIYDKLLSLELEIFDQKYQWKTNVKTVFGFNQYIVDGIAF